MAAPGAIEQDLMRLVPEAAWTTFGPALILHGREVCKAKLPRCDGCAIERACAKVGVTATATATATTTTKRERRPRPAATTTEETETMPTDAKRWNGPLPQLPGGWHDVLAPQMESDWFRSLWGFVKAERAAGQVFPPENEVFSAFEYAPYARVKLVLIGQDPYHDDGQAHGLCFSVKRGVPPPPSLKNMYKELDTDLGIPPPSHGCLEDWARQGVLLLNAVLTVRAHTPNSHKDHGWEKFTDQVIAALDAGPCRIVFALWGAYAQKKGKRIDATRHVVVKAAHPSPLSAKQFLGSKPFTAIDAALVKAGHDPLRWQL